VIAADDPKLNPDPGKIALGDAGAAKAAAESPDPQGPACSASVSAFRSALVFKNIFTALVAILACLTLGALAFCIVEVIANSSWQATNTLAVIAGVVTGAGALFLRRERSKSDKILEQSLADVQKYCGTSLAAELQ
jgi:hypothetical protein